MIYVRSVSPPLISVPSALICTSAQDLVLESKRISLSTVVDSNSSGMINRYVHTQFCLCNRGHMFRHLMIEVPLTKSAFYMNVKYIVIPVLWF